MKAYHVYRHYGQYSDRYPNEDYGYYTSKSHAERVQTDAENEKSSRGYVEIEDIEVDETP